MAYPIRRKRLLVYVSLLLLPLVLVYVVAQSAVTWWVYKQFMQQASLVAAAPISQLQQSLANVQQQLKLHQDQADAVRGAFKMSDDEWQDWKDATVAEINKEIAQLQSQLQAAQAAQPAQPNIPILQEWLKAIIAPCSQAPGPVLTLAGGAIQYPPSAQLYAYTQLANAAYGGPFQAVYEFILNSSAWVPWSTVVLVPAGFVLLPVSRRRAKVRWAHIGRVLVYSAFIPVTLVCAGALLFAVPPPRPIGFAGFAWLLTTWCVPICVIIWWSIAIDRYLHLQHAVEVSIVLCVLSILLAFAVGFYWQHPMTPGEMWMWTKTIAE